MIRDFGCFGNARPVSHVSLGHRVVLLNRLPPSLTCESLLHGAGPPASARLTGSRL